MKNLKSLIALVLCVSTLLVQAQNRDVSINISEPKEKGLSEGNLGVVGTTNDGGFYVLRTKGGSSLGLTGFNVGGKASIFVDKYNSKLEKEESASIDGVEITTAGRAKGSSYEFTVQDENNNLYVYFSEFVKGINSLYSLKLDTESFEFVEEKLVYEDRSVNRKLDRRATYAIVESEDRNKFAIYSFVNERFGFVSEIYVETFNRNMESEWMMYEIVDGSTRGNINNVAFRASSNSSVGNTTFSISLSNDGVVNVMQKIYDDSFANLFGAGNYFHQIYSLSDDGKLRSTVFDNEEKFIVEAMIRHDQNDNLSLVGYVGDRELLIDGVIFRNMDAVNFETIQNRIVPFSPEQKKQFLVSEDNGTRKRFSDKRTERRIDKGRKVRISARNNLINAYVHDDNSITIAGEYFDTVVTSSPGLGTAGGPGNARFDTETNYIFGDMKFVNVSAEGEINWVKNIHKYQKKTSLRLLSVSELFLDNKVNFIYNDFEERKLMLLTIDQDGNHVPHTIADLGRRGDLENHWFVPSSVKYLTESKIVGFANKLLRTKIIEINL